MSNGTPYPDDALYPVSEEMQGWGAPLQLSGDFYHEPDDVTRGVSIPPAALDLPYMSNSFADLDFCCHEPADALKGLSLGSAMGFDMEPFGTPECLGVLPGQAAVGLGPGGLAVPAGAERFTATDHPPPAPLDELYEFAATTLRVRSASPLDIGNHLLDFLETQVTSTTMKVNRLKFTIKVNVFNDNTMCTAKIRTYREAPETFAIEFQRRKGDCVAFSKVFLQAAQYLSARLEAVPAAPVPATPGAGKAPQLQLLSDSRPEDSLDLLLDLANDDCPPLQAEAAISLADVAQDGAGAASLCNARAFRGLKELLKSTQDDVAYPTATALSALSQRPEAMSCFAEQDILPLVIDKIRSTATSELVQRELARALNTVITGCAERLSDKVSEEIMHSLADAAKDAHFGHASVYWNLQGARSALKCRPSGAPTLPTAPCDVVQRGAGTSRGGAGPA
mmetsp:Transcript_19196/g.55746  ORF Transcript_19196/g.55746 Transcript_19196/m.55746 type:complete len:451 (+) Transcript_19196:187-1539(+)